MRNFYSQNYNLVYIDCNDLVLNVFLSINKLNISLDNLKPRDFKKLVFHYVVEELLKKNKFKSKRPVYFFNKTFLASFCDKKYIECFLYSLKQLKNLLPVPVIFLENSDLFLKNNGDLKELEEKITNYYIKHKRSTYKLRKYLENEEFYELVNKLNDIKNIKLLST